VHVDAPGHIGRRWARYLPMALAVVACAAPPSAEPEDTSDQEICAPWAEPAAPGTHRHEVAGDAVIPLVDGEIRLSETWTGCGPHGFLVGDLSRSETEAASVWKRDVPALLAASPPDSHWWFVSRGDRASAQREEIVKRLDDLPEATQAAWAGRLHVIDKPADKLDGWLGEVLAGVGVGGFTLDTAQRLRGMGSLADVTRETRGDWPWENNLAYAAHDLQWLVEDVRREQEWAAQAEGATDVAVWTGEVLAGFAEADVTLPDASTMLGFDTLELEVDLRCPDATRAEAGNCGAWDYLASLQRIDGAEPVELARFITPYHREARWRVDITPMLPHLLDGGGMRLRWDFAPEWNTQPTETRLTLRLADRGRGERPRTATRVGTGGPFNTSYNADRGTIDAEIGPSTARTELYAVISGHGAATDSCAEFCDHRHTWTIGSSAYEASFPEAATQDGCLGQIGKQMTPNQWGTWWFGRGGWCPGQPVHTWRWDVTNDVSPGSVAGVAYAASLSGRPPPDDAGDVNVAAWLVTYE
jgi:hypothetical protein